MICAVASIATIIIVGKAYVSDESLNLVIIVLIWVLISAVPVNVILRLTVHNLRHSDVNASWWHRSLRFLVPEGQTLGSIYLVYSSLLSASVLILTLTIPVLSTLIETERSTIPAESFFSMQIAVAFGVGILSITFPILLRHQEHAHVSSAVYLMLYSIPIFIVTVSLTSIYSENAKVIFYVIYLLDLIVVLMLSLGGIFFTTFIVLLIPTYRIFRDATSSDVNSSDSNSMNSTPSHTLHSPAPRTPRT